MRLLLGTSKFFLSFLLAKKYGVPKFFSIVIQITIEKNTPFSAVIFRTLQVNLFDNMEEFFAFNNNTAVFM